MSLNARVVFGGAFDPVHVGHLALAEFVSSEMDQARVLFMPAALSPFKSRHQLSFDQRAEMLSVALEGTSFELDLREGLRTGPSYTVQSLRELSLEDTSPIYLLVGEDNLHSFKQWKEYENILKLARLLVVNRPSVTSIQSDLPHHLLQWPGMELSSTWLRERLAESKPCKHLLPRGVWELIQKRSFYACTREEKA